MRIEDARIGQEVEVSFRGVIKQIESRNGGRVDVFVQGYDNHVLMIPVEFVHKLEEPPHE